MSVTKFFTKLMAAFASCFFVRCCERFVDHSSDIVDENSSGSRPGQNDFLSFSVFNCMDRKRKNIRFFVNSRNALCTKVASMTDLS